MSLKVELRYLKELDVYKEEKPFQIFTNIPESSTDQRLSNLEFEEKEVVLHDIRESLPPTLDGNGFTIKHHVSSMPVDSFSEREVVDEIYLQEMETLLRSEDSSIDRIFFFEWRLRSSEDQGRMETLNLNDMTTILKPALSVHIDQSPAAVLNRIKLQLGDDADFLLKGRVRILNLWKSLNGPVEDYPIAVCDGTTVEGPELIASDHVRREFLGETFYLHFRESHKWFYLSLQEPQEVLIMKMFDSQSDAKARFCPHSSFKMPAVKMGSRPRRSIEVRALVFNYPKDT